MRALYKSFWLSVCTMVLCAGAAHAFQFKASDTISGSLDTQFTLGAGMRMVGQNPQLIGDPSVNSGANTGFSSNGDDGNLNYNKYDLYTTYLKITPELLLKFPGDFKFMARATGLYDWGALDTQRTELSQDAKDQLAPNIQLLDLWVSKDMNLGSQRARVRLGYQVINWGESIFGIGGINATNSLDFQRFQVPGTQIKEAVLPAPILSFASGLGRGVNFEAYYQFRWNKNRLPPVGSYYSVADILGKGKQPLFINVDPFSSGFVNFGGLDPAADPSQANTFAVPIVDDITPSNSGQYGVAMHYKPQGVSLDLGFYFMNYHDKMPVLSSLANATAQWSYLEDRKMYGVSANFPVGNWAVGWELSYRPKDAVALTGCYNPGGPLDGITNYVQDSAGVPIPVDCPMYIDEKKYQMHLTGLLSLTPGDHGWFLDLLKADTATFTGEIVGIRYPGVSPDKRYTRDIGGVPVMQAPAAGYGFWKNGTITTDVGVGTQTYDTIAGVGDANSLGFTVDFNWAYDNKILKGWTVIPGVTYFRAVSGNTPTLTANYLEGAQSMNTYILFNQSAPTRWQAGINYLNYWGTNQLLGDRDFIGGFVTRNF